MAQKWYNRATVQAAIVTGMFTLAAAILMGFFGLYSGFFTSKKSSPASPEVITRDYSSSKSNKAYLKQDDSLSTPANDKNNHEISRKRESPYLQIDQDNFSATPKSNIDNLVTDIKRELGNIDVVINRNPVIDRNSGQVFLKIEKKYKDKNYIIKVLKTLTSDREPYVRWKAFKGLSYYNYSDYESILDFYRAETNWSVRYLVFEAADNLSKEEAISFLEMIYKNDVNAGIRRKALNKLFILNGQCCRESLIPHLLHATSDESHYVREDALDNLKALRVEESIDRAKYLIMYDKNNSVRVAAAELLAELGSIKTAQYIFKAL